MPHEIHIIGSNASTGELVLSDGGYTQADRAAVVKWTIDDPNVKSIEIVRKRGSSALWSSPPRDHGDRWQGTTGGNVPDGTIYEYSINWESSQGSHTHDPIISIRPTGGIHEQLTIAFLAGVAVTALFAMMLFSKQQRKAISYNKHHKDPGSF